MPLIAILGFTVFIFIFFLATSVRVMQQYERAVIFTLGKFTSVSGPGLIVLIPLIQEMVRVDLRMMVEDVPSQDVISKDNVTVKVSAVLYYQIVAPERAVIQVANFRRATLELAQTTLRSVLGKHELDDMLSDRDKLNIDIQSLIDSQTEGWGVKVTNVEIKHVDLDESMIRAMAKQAEAERMRRAKIINAEGEFQAAEKLVEAGRMLAQDDNAMQLRYLSTLQEVSASPNNTIVLPMPFKLLEKLVGGERS